MNGIVLAVHECGPTAYLAILLGMLGWLALAGAAVAFVVKSARASAWVGGAAVLLGFLSIGAGALGVYQGEQATHRAVASLEQGSPPGDGSLTLKRVMIAREGEKEAWQCWSVGEDAGGIPLALGLVAVAAAAVSARRRRTQRALEAA